MPVRFTITISTDGAAFTDDWHGEAQAVAERIADKVAASLAHGFDRPVVHHVIRDTNGNLAGHLMVEGLPEEDDGEEGGGEVIWMKIVPNVRTGGREGNA